MVIANNGEMQPVALRFMLSMFVPIVTGSNWLHGLLCLAYSGFEDPAVSSPLSSRR